jgi:hypothetical protein
MSEPIDVVISWVDGSDPDHKKKLQPFLEAEFGKKFSKIPEDIAGETRFRSVGEIFYCVGSILRFAPFVRNIFIITDNQQPGLTDFVQQNFPETKTAIKLIDHTEIFSGYEKVLPVFNSLSIETLMFRISGLSENFVYFNDDFFLVRPIVETDWFIDNQAVGYGYWRNMAIDMLLWLFKPKQNGHKPFGFKDSMLNAAKELGLRWTYFHIDHTPQALKKSILEKYYTENPQKLIANISHKFRHETQFNPQALFYMMSLKAGKSVSNSKIKLLYIKPVNREKSYLDRKFKTFESQPDITFCCVGSLDLANENDKQNITNWLKSILIISLPEDS